MGEGFFPGAKVAALKSTFGMQHEPANRRTGHTLAASKMFLPPLLAISSNCPSKSNRSGCCRSDTGGNQAWRFGLGVSCAMPQVLNSARPKQREPLSHNISHGFLRYQSADLVAH
jgi:hypothetical protein